MLQTLLYITNIGLVFLPYSQHAEHYGTMKLKIPTRCHFVVEHLSQMLLKRMVDGKAVVSRTKILSDQTFSLVTCCFLGEVLLLVSYMSLCGVCREAGQ